MHYPGDRQSLSVASTYSIRLSHCLFVERLSHREDITPRGDWHDESSCESICETARRQCWPQRPCTPMTEPVHYAAPRVRGCFAARDGRAAYGVGLSSPCDLRWNGHGAQQEESGHGALISCSGGQPHPVLRKGTTKNYIERDQFTRSRFDGPTEQGWGSQGRQATKTDNIHVHERARSCVKEKATKTQHTHTKKSRL